MWPVLNDFISYSLICLFVLLVPFVIVIGVVAAVLGKERGSKAPKKAPCKQCKRLMSIDDLACPHCGAPIC